MPITRKRAVFAAVIPSTATAIRIHGDEGMRLTLDIPASEAE